MSVSFGEVPANLRLPWLYAEFDNSEAVQGPQLMKYRGLLVGQKTSAGTQAALTPARITSAAHAAILFGPGSMLYGMAQAWFARNTYTEIWAVAFADPGSSVAAGGAIALGGSTTGSGTLSLYLAGRLVALKVTAGDSLSSLATALAAAINADTSLPLIAAVDGSVNTKVNLTAKNAGLVGNDHDVRLNYFDEATPVGLTATITAFSGGSGVPNFTTLWAALGDTHYNIWALPYTDSASLAEVGNELGRRSGPTRQTDALAFMAKKGSVSALGTFGTGLNEEFFCCTPVQNSPTQTAEIAAEVAALAAQYGQADPARPFQTLALAWTKAPKVSDRFTAEERNLLLFDGISSWHVDAAGKIIIDRLITTYQHNGAGADDTSYLDVNTVLTISYLRYDFRNHMLRKFPRHKLADDGVRVGFGQAVVTPKIAKAECFNKFREWEEIGLVENFEQFKRDIIVERNVSDPNRLDFVLPPDLVNQLIVMAVKISFRLQGVNA